jgi:hypothetical protein
VSFTRISFAIAASTVSVKMRQSPQRACNGVQSGPSASFAPPPDGTVRDGEPSGEVSCSVSAAFTGQRSQGRRMALTSQRFHGVNRDGGRWPCANSHGAVSGAIGGCRFFLLALGTPSCGRPREGRAKPSFPGFSG